MSKGRKTRPKVVDDPTNSQAITPAAREDIEALLGAYERVLRLARRPPASVAFPRTARRLKTVHIKFRPTWGTEMWTAHHVRRGVDTLSRSYALRQSAGHGGEHDEAVSLALHRFATALPRPPTRLSLVLGAVLAILLGQFVFDGLIRLLADTGFVSDDSLEQALGNLEIAPEVKALGDLGSALAESDAAAVFAFLTTISVTLYVFFRPLASGFQIARWLLASSDRLPRWRFGAELQEQARRIGLRSVERRVFSALEVDPPHNVPVDVLAKAVVLLPALYLAAYLLDVAPNEPPPAFWILVIFVALRLTWLLAQLRRRRVSAAWLVLPALVVAAAAIAASEPSSSERSRDLNSSYYQRTQSAPDSAEIERRPSDQLRLTLALRQDLSGADLMGRSLYRYYLAGKRLAYANLSYADLQRADLFRAKLTAAQMVATVAKRSVLQQADLRGAVLTRADLEGADVRFAQLQYADLTGANLVGASLYGANLRYANLNDAQLAHADLRKAQLQNAYLGSADFLCTGLQGADLRGVTFTAIREISVVANENTRWSHPHPSPVSFYDCWWSQRRPPQERSDPYSRFGLRP
jgi:uncharacterized protein YjbI with pentapeptide repeats